MDREYVIQLINSHHQVLQKNFGVKHLYLFGSVARNEASPTSDVDFLVEFSRSTGLFGLISLQLFLEKELGRNVDLGTYESLKSYIKEDVDRDMLIVA
jgi:uncharacterized protein